ncbi:UNVERIFIED_CONTAM: Transposon Tf2-12 polyprotein [Sesamum latifolium]|uniref:Transposon Tf2-12 polyprotein n=1 Tax=Sesamum latifolium TaxID=2727402 RepID=A0AAW2XMR5_9LAMI
MEYQKKGAFKVTAYSKKNTKSSPTQKLRSLIPSRMRRQTTLEISCGEVLKVKAQTMVFTQVQSDDEDDRESVASSNYINNSTEEDFAQIYHITLIEDGEIEEEDAEDAPVGLEEGVKATIDELREVNLGNTEDPRPIYTSASLTQEEEEAYIMLLHEFKDVFAWSYKEIPGLDPKIQPIRMAPADEELTAFRTPKGIYCYKVMPFGLKNAGATYQRAMQRIFDDMLHKNVECYVDDLVVKSKEREDHLYDLRKVFQHLRRYQLKMNPSKCAFGTTSGKISWIHRPPAGRLMKKDVPFEWDEACDEAFKSIKSYLMKPPVLVAPVHGRPLILYVAAQERSVGILLAQKNNEGKENALYYLKVEALFQSHSIHLVSKANPLKYVMTKPVLSDRLARCYLQLQQFEITYIPQKAIKGQVLADFLADHPMPAEWELSDNLPDEDVLVVEIILLGRFKKPELLPYHNYAKRLMGWLGDVELEYLPRRDNKQADALAKLASILSMTDKEARIPICKSWIIPPIFSDDEDDTFQEEENHVMEVFEIEEEDCRQPLVDYLKYGKLPRDAQQRLTQSVVNSERADYSFYLSELTTTTIYYKGTLYRRSFEGIFLRCLSDDEKDQAMEEAHSGVCGAHQSGPKLHFRIKRMGYYWPAMVKDCIDYAKRCQACQFYANLIHQPPEPLHPTVAS